MGKIIKIFLRYLFFGTIGKFRLVVLNFSSLIDFLYLKYYGIETKFGYVKLYGFPHIQRASNSRIVIGKNVTLVSSTRYNIAGINHAVILATLTSDAMISIDEGSGISGAVICAVNKISIGKHVGIGANSKIYDSDFHPLQPGKRLRQKSILDAKNAVVTIGDYAWIGEGALVLKGAQMGIGTVLSARSVLTSKAKDFSVYVGNPASFTKDIANDIED